MVRVIPHLWPEQPKVFLLFNFDKHGFLIFDIYIPKNEK